MRARSAFLNRVFGRTGARLALLQAAVVAFAFAVAGYGSQIAINHINRDQTRREVQGEMRSMEDEYRSLGGAHVPLVVAKRTRLWRGFAYLWASRDSRDIVGALPDGAATGWSIVRLARADPHSGGDRFLVLTEQLPDGARLSVGQDMAAERSEDVAIGRALALSGLAGVGICLTASYIFSRRAWRRIDALVTSAKTVAAGRLDARVPMRVGPVQDDLDELGGAYNAMLDRLEELIAQVRQVSSDIAHDLRTPLTRVRQRLDQLRGLDDAEIRREAIGRIEADLDRVLGMFAALLRLAEIESDADRRFEATVDLRSLVLRMADAYRPDIEESGRSLAIEAASVLVRGDAGLIAQAVANMLDNVLAHTHAGASVVVRAGVEDGAPVLSVTDDGPGIPDDQREAALLRCRRLDTSRSGAGFGLGLAIVSAIARRHRAQVALRNARPGLSVAIIFAGQA